MFHNMTARFSLRRSFRASWRCHNIFFTLRSIPYPKKNRELDDEFIASVLARFSIDSRGRF